jgi:hypothetical protein
MFSVCLVNVYASTALAVLWVQHLGMKHRFCCLLFI